MSYSKHVLEYFLPIEIHSIDPSWYHPHLVRHTTCNHSAAQRLLSLRYFAQYKETQKEIGHQIMYREVFTLHFFLPLPLLLLADADGAGLEAILEAREDGATDVALLPATDRTLSSALFCENIS